MVRIGLISDTHGWLDPRVAHHFAACDEIWHAGDIGDLSVTEELSQIAPVRAVHGNIDDAKCRAVHPEHQRFRIEGKTIWMTHIGGRPPRYARYVLPELKRLRPGIFVCGHSHILAVRFDKALGTLYLNPGAAGRHGFHHVRTLLRFAIKGEAVEQLEVIELGPRSAQAVK